MPTLAASAPIQSQRILLIDAQLPVRDACAAHLHRAGYRVDAADDAVAGWAAMRGNGYDLLVVDLSLPGGSGLRLIARLRSAHIMLPVILIAGTVTPEPLGGTTRLHLAATIARPFTPEQLLETAIGVLQASSRTPSPDTGSLALLCCTA